MSAGREAFLKAALKKLPQLSVFTGGPASGTLALAPNAMLQKHTHLSVLH